jgi:hypothetical protein
MSILYRVEGRNLLTGLLSGEGGFQGPARVLDGLTSQQAHAKPHGLPHSIAEIVAHMCFWPEWFNGCAARGFTGAPLHAEEGWPPVPADGWEALRSRYFAVIEESKRIVAESAVLHEPVLPPGVPIPFLAKESRLRESCTP